MSILTTLQTRQICLRTDWSWNSWSEEHNSEEAQLICKALEAAGKEAKETKAGSTEAKVDLCGTNFYLFHQ